MPFIIVRNDITAMEADAIVNTANPMPTYASGSDYAVYRAAGIEQLLAARQKIGVMVPGQAEYTPAFNLRAKYIIHTVGPAWCGGDFGEDETLARCYKNCLELAKKLGCKSIAFPFISTGVYGFPKERAMLIAQRCVYDFLMTCDMMVYLTVFGRDSLGIASKLFPDIKEYINARYVEDRTLEEYYSPQYGGYENEFGSYGDHYRSERSGFRPGEEGFRASLSRRFRRQEKSAYMPFESLPPDETDAAFECFAPSFSLGRAADNDSDAFDSDDFDGLPFADEADESAELLSSTAGQAAAPAPKPFAAEKAAAHAAPRAPRQAQASPEAIQRSLESVVQNLEESFQQRLLRLMKERGMKPVEVYTRANMDKKQFSRIKTNRDYVPLKRSCIALAIALRLNLDETKDLLQRAGYAFSPSSRTDLAVQYCIENGVYDVLAIDAALFEMDLPMLSSY